jgi:hypothetical protein
MAKAKVSCRHNRAWPTIFNSTQGFLWCSDCGAIRLLKIARTDGPISGTTANSGGFVYAQKRWLYPRGHEDVLRQLERMEAV